MAVSRKGGASTGLRVSSFSEDEGDASQQVWLWIRCDVKACGVAASEGLCFTDEITGEFIF